MTHPEISSNGKLSTDSRLQFNEPDVVGKVIDGEAIIINLASGVYCGLSGVGAAIWELLGAGHSIAETSGVLAERYGVARETTERDTLELTQRLVDESLLCLDENRVEAALEPPIASIEAGSYERPELEVFTDMAELLALDPPMPGMAGTGWADSSDEV